MADPYKLSGGQVAGNILGGGASGAATGAAMGSVVPGLGTAVGAGIGAVGGLIAGGLQSMNQQKQLSAAEQQQQELEDELEAAGADFNLFRQGQNMQSGSNIRSAEIKAQQAAARGGLSGASSAALQQQAREGAARTAAMQQAQLGQAAIQAKLSEQQMILQSSRLQQDLAQENSPTSDILGALGDVAGTTSEMARLKAGGVGSTAKDATSPANGVGIGDVTDKGQVVQTGIGKDGKQVMTIAEDNSERQVNVSRLPDAPLSGRVDPGAQTATTQRTSAQTGAQGAQQAGMAGTPGAGRATVGADGSAQLDPDYHALGINSDEYADFAQSWIADPEATISAMVERGGDEQMMRAHSTAATTLNEKLKNVQDINALMDDPEFQQAFMVLFPGQTAADIIDNGDGTATLKF